MPVVLTYFMAGCFSHTFALFLLFSEDVQGNHVPAGNFFSIKAPHTNTSGKLWLIICSTELITCFIPCSTLFDDLHSHGFRLCTSINCGHTRLHNHRYNLYLLITQCWCNIRKRQWPDRAVLSSCSSYHWTCFVCVCAGIWRSSQHC